MTINQVLSKHYNISNATLTVVPPGWSALAYRVEDGNRRYFLKVYDKTRYSSQVWIQGIDRYMPTVVWLGEQTSLRGRIPHVIPTADGSYKYENDEKVYILFDWIDGVTPRDEPLTKPQLASLALIIAELHTFTEKIPTQPSIIREGYDIPFYDSLMQRAQNADENIPSEYLQTIIDKLHHLSDVSKTLPALNIPYTLCHNDIHGWNVITQGDRLVLLDWEGLQFAPREADLFMFKYERYWGQRWNEFFDEYKKIHPNLELNETVMRFFQLRRRLTDIDEFINNITLDNASDDVIEEAKHALIRECGLL
jgi:Ser/Thr protein kinase RdoA (MazF antagonist)